MTNTYLNQLINEFDQEFESLVIPFPESYVVNNVEVSSEVNSEVNSVSNNNQVVKNDNELAEKLNKIKSLAVEISAERYSPNYNPEICLANLLNYIGSADDQDLKKDFFQLLDQDHNLNLDQALTDFDFYMNNPYKKKAEKILSKIEARKNK
jgi:hypothetical protein